MNLDAEVFADRRSVAIASLGCKLNQAEAEELGQRFVKAGFQIVRPEDGADVFILNSCTVTHVADRKSRQLLRQARRANPDGLVVATGCYAHRAPEVLDAMPEVSLVVNNLDKMRLPNILGGDENVSMDDSVRPSGRTRAMVKIQEGCNQICAYCIVPKTRGRERSLAMDDIVGTVQRRVASGYREVVLTGTQLGTYGYEFGYNPLGRPWYEALVVRVLEETGVERLRFSSLQPQEITSGLMELYAQGRLCPHVHMPLQSGSDTVLQRMRRRYTTAQYMDVVMRLRAAVPSISITTDLIVGFPGETDFEFDEGFEFVRDAGLAGVHVFPYSMRPGTTAAYLPEQVAPAKLWEREELILQMADNTGKAHRRRFVGSRATVLWEGTKVVEGSPVWTGLTENYIRVYTSSTRTLTNHILRCFLKKEMLDAIWVDVMDVDPVEGFDLAR